jgi:FtsZ-binding cell division protein ZapB
MDDLTKLLKYIEEENCEKSYEETLKERITELENQITLKDMEIKQLKEENVELEKKLNHKNSSDKPKTMRGYNNRVPEHKVKYMIEQYSKGDSIASISRAINVSANTIDKILKKQGLK